MKRRAGVGFVALASLSAVATVIASACGGKVDGASGYASAEPTATAIAQRPPSGSFPTRPPSGPMSAAGVASEIAETYCKAFSSCCVGAGQPPIDVARCRELVSVAVEASVLPNAELGAAAVATCVDTIKGRIAACSNVDAAWWTSSSVPLLSPTSVATACSSIFGSGSAGKATEACTSDASCIAPSKCAVDQCVEKGAIGATCVATSGCLDGAACIAATCSAPRDVVQGGACAGDEECRLGLVCAKGLCAPAREHPELSKARFSPYRVGADTCRAYTYL